MLLAPMLDLIVNSAVTHSLLLVLPIVCALLLRLARCPGSGVLGGVLAGLLLGPTILGRRLPDEFERMFIGGVSEHATYLDVERAQERERAAAEAAGVGSDAITAMIARHADEREAALGAMQTARWTHQRPIRSYTAAVLVLTLLGAGWRRVPADGDRIRLAGPASIGPWSAVVPGGLAFLVVSQWNYAAPVATLAAAAVAVGPWILAAGDRAVADAAEQRGARTVERAGRIASVAALIVFGATYVLRYPDRALWALPLLAIPAGWLLPVITRRGRAIDLVLECALVPSLAACVALKIDLNAHFSLWPVLGFVLVSGDGRWLGAFTGAMLAGGRRPLVATRLVLGSMACGPTQLAFTAIAVTTWAIPEDVATALLIGAMSIEVTAPARRRVAERLADVEE